MQKGGPTAHVADDEERLFDGLVFVPREENIVEPKAEPGKKRPEGPDQIEKGQEDESFFVQ